MGHSRILLAEADTRSGLAVARSAVRAGYEPVGALVDPNSFVARSRAFRKGGVLAVPDPGKDEAGFRKRVFEEARARDCVGVVPITDLALSALSGERSDDVTFIGPSQESAELVIDKEKHLALAHSLGLPCPTEVPVASPEDVTAASRDHPFPWVIKLRDKRTRHEALPGFAVWHVDSPDEAREKLEVLSRLGISTLVQRYYAGRIHNLCCFAVEGKMVAAHEYVSLRRSASTGILREIVEADPSLLDFAGRVLEATRWEGVANVQFIVGEGADAVRYLETNGRFWASTQGSINAGWDFPRWAIEYFLRGRVPEPGPLRVGSRTCYHAGDLRALIRYLMGGASPTTGREPGVLGAILDYLKGFGPTVRSDVLRFAYPIPGWVEHWRLLMGSLSKLRRRTREN